MVELVTVILTGTIYSNTKELGTPLPRLLASLALALLIESFLAAMVKQIETLLSNGWVVLGLAALIGLGVFVWWKRRNHDFRPY